MSFSLFAQTTGKISGLIKDKSDSAPLPGANVYLENTSFGSASDESGRFALINIPPGKYNLKIDYKDEIFMTGPVSDIKKIDLKI